MKWPENMPRRASIANFGVGGSNTHAILEDPKSYFASIGIEEVSASSNSDCPSEPICPQSPASNADCPSGQITPQSSASNSDWSLIDANPTNGFNRYLLVFTNRDKQFLDSYLTESFYPYLQDADSDKHMPSLAYTLCERRSHFSWRTCIISDSAENILQNTASFNTNTKRVSSTSIKVAFAFTGQGAQWARMGYELIESYPVFAQCIKEAQNHLRALGASWNIYGTFIR